MKTLYLFLFILPFLSWGQESSKKLSEIKLYTNYNAFSSPSIEIDTNGVLINKTYKNSNGLWFSPALTFSLKNKDFIEIELSRLNFSKNKIKNTVTNDTTGNTYSVYGNTELDFSLHIRTEYQLVLFKNKDWQKLSAIAGLSLTPYVNRTIIQPVVSNSFRQSQTNVGASISLIPRLKYKLNEKWFIDLNTPVIIGTFDNHSKRTENPTTPINQRRKTTATFSSPFELGFRLGIGIFI